MYKHSLVLGKFLPPHLGHAYLIDTARGQSERVTVIAGATSKEPIPGALRYQWLARHYKGTNVTVVPLHEDLPQEPAESENFWPLWKSRINVLAPNLDAVFTSELYGTELGRQLNIPHVLVDLPRLTYPTSGTRCRADPMGQWNFLLPEAKPYFLNRIVIVGPESTGKSTLAQQLAEHYKTIWVSEFARDYIAANIPDYKFAPEHMLTFARGQCDLEDALSPDATRLLFCDTDALTSSTWSQLYFNTVLPQFAPLLSRRYALTLFCDSDLPWFNDGTRFDGHRRTRHTELLKSALAAASRPYTIVSGTGEARLRVAIDIVDKAFSSLGG